MHHAKARTNTRLYIKLTDKNNSDIKLKINKADLTNQELKGEQLKYKTHKKKWSYYGGRQADCWINAKPLTVLAHGVPWPEHSMLLQEPCTSPVLALTV